MGPRSSSLLRATTLAAAAIAWIPSAATAQWEEIREDYANVRGTNYVPVYEQLHDTNNRPAGYVGVACATAMWRFFDAPGSRASIEYQLDLVKGAGFNAVRVWMSYPLWWADRDASSNRMLTRFRDFLQMCEARHLYVMPVLWDDHCYGQSPCTPPDYSDPIGLQPPYNNISHWTPNPGQPRINAFKARGFDTPGFKNYVRELAAVGKESPALLMWDIMNEPVVDANDTFHQRELMEHTLEILDDEHPEGVTTIGFIGVIDGDPIAELAATRSST